MCSSLSTMEKARIQLQETPEQMLYFFLDGGIPAEPLKQKTLASSSTPPPAQLLLQHCRAIPNTAPEILRSYTDNDLMAIIEMMKHIVYVSLYHLLQTHETIVTKVMCRCLHRSSISPPSAVKHGYISENWCKQDRRRKSFVSFIC